MALRSRREEKDDDGKDRPAVNLGCQKNTMNSLADLILESDVYRRFDGLFTSDELRQARVNREIAYYPRGRAFYYTEVDLVAYVQSKRVEATRQANKALDPSREIPRDP